MGQTVSTYPAGDDKVLCHRTPVDVLPRFLSSALAWLCDPGQINPSDFSVSLLLICKVEIILVLYF